MKILKLCLILFIVSACSEEESNYEEITNLESGRYIVTCNEFIEEVYKVNEKQEDKRDAQWNKELENLVWVINVNNFIEKDISVAVIATEELKKTEDLNYVKPEKIHILDNENVLEMKIDKYKVVLYQSKADHEVYMASPCANQKLIVY